MFREIHDDKITLAAIPWHGLIVDGTLHVPGVADIAGAASGSNTGLFDVGMPAVETPAEIAALGGAVWNRAIVNWSDDTPQVATYHAGLTRAPGGNLGVPLVLGGLEDGRPDVRTVNVDLENASLDLVVQIGGVGTRRIALELADLGQGAGQPDVRVPRLQDGFLYLAPPAGYRLQLFDFRAGKMLFGVYGYHFSVAPADRYDVGWLIGKSPPNPPLGMIEVEVFEQDGVTHVRHAVIEDRAAALGGMTLSGSEAGGLMRTWVDFEHNVTEGIVGFPACSGQDVTTTTIDVINEHLPGYIEINDITVSGVGAYSSSYSMTIASGLLAGRYTPAGDIVTARYAAHRAASRSKSHTLASGGARVNTRTASEAQSGDDGCHFETNSTGAATAVGTLETQTHGEQHLRIYGFSGEIVDELAWSFSGSESGIKTWLTTEPIPPGNQYTSSLERHDAGIETSFSDDRATGWGDARYMEPVPAPAIILDVLSGMTRAASLAHYSNNLVGALMFRPVVGGGVVDLRQAAHWAGVESSTITLPVSGGVMPAYSGSYNPVTHEVVRGSNGWYSWV